MFLKVPIQCSYSITTMLTSTATLSYLGYNIYHVPLDSTYADFVNLYSAVQILAENHSVIVCGENIERCIYSVATYVIYTNWNRVKLVELASSLLY